MSLLSPLFLFGALAVAVPIVLHLFARESAPMVAFSATRFLRRTATEHVRRRWPRDLLLLLLRAAALVLLALAFARPFWASPPEASGRGLTVVVVDQSASLSAPATWRRAVEAARAAVADAPPRHEVALVGYQERASVVVDPTPSRQALLDRLDALRPGSGGADVAAGIRAAAALLEGRPGGIIVVTDLQDDGAPVADVAVPEDITLRVVLVPMPAGNLALSALEVIDGRTLATVTNTGVSDRETSVRFAVDQTPVAAASARVAAGASVSVTGPAVLTAAGVLSASVDDVEGIAADNQRWTVLDGPPRVPVLVVTSAEPVGDQAFYVERALRTAGPEVAFDLEVAAADSARLEQPEATARASVVVLTGTRGLSRGAVRRLAARVEDGAGLLVALGPHTSPGIVQDLLGSRDRVRAAQHAAAPADLAMAVAAPRHQALLGLQGQEAALSQVRFWRTVPFAWQESDVVMRFTDGRAALVEGRLGRGRAMVFASDLGRSWNDWPVQPTFLPWFHETVRVLAGQPHWPRAVDAGSLLVADGTPAGVVALAGSSRRVAVNVPASESVLDRQPANAIVAAVSRTAVDRTARQADVDAKAETRQALWRYVLLAMLLVLVAETLVARRRAPAAAGRAQLIEER